MSEGSNRRLARRHRIGPPARSPGHAAGREVRRRRAQLHAGALRGLRPLPSALCAEDRVGVADAGDSAADRCVRGVANRARAHRARTAGQRAAGRGLSPLMLTFVLLAAALTVAGAIAVAIPLLKSGAAAEAAAPAPWAALAATEIGRASCRERV